MNNLKRLLTMAMAVAMTMSLFVVGTTAAKFSDDKDIENDTAVDMNVALNIINGRTDGSFDPQGTVTRAEMAKMITIVINGGNAPRVGEKATPTYTDIKGHWGEAYIEFCSSLSIVSGMGDGTFVPDGKVTGTQAAKMLLVTLGYSADTEGFNGPAWSVKINVAASNKKLYDDVENRDPNAPLTRDDAAQMVWNALQAVNVDYDYKLTTVDGTLTTIQVAEDDENDKTLLESEFKADTIEAGTLISYSYDDDDEEYTYTFDNGTAAVYTAEDVLDDTKDANKDNLTFKSDNDYTDLFAMPVTVVKEDGTKDIYGMFAPDAVVLAEGLLSDIDYTATDDELDFNDKDYDVNVIEIKDIPAYAENIYYTADGETLADVKDENCTARLIDTDDDDDVDCITYLPFTAAEVTYKNNDKVKIDNGIGILEFEDNDIYDDVEKEDYVIVYKKANLASDENKVVAMDSISGIVTGVKTDKIALDGTWYTIAGDDVDPDLDDEYTFYVVNDSVYFATEGDNANTIDDIAYVEALAGAKGVDDARAKLVFADGSKDTVSIEKLEYFVADDFVKLEDSAITETAVAENGVADLVDQMVTFSTKNGKYSIKEILQDENDAGYDTFADATGTANVTAATDDRVGALELGGTTYTIANDAVVFLNENNDYDVITGAELKDLSKKDGDPTLAIKEADFAQVLANEKNGVNIAEVVVIKTTVEIPNDRGNTENYGYVFEAFKGTYDGDDAVVLKMWNAEFGKEVKGFYVGGDLDDYPVGTIVEYSQLADQEIDDVVDITDKALTDLGAVVAVQADDFVDMRFDGDDADSYIDDADDASVRYYFTDDTQYIFCDTDKDDDVNNFMNDGVIDEADKDIENPDYNSDNNVIYIANAMVLVDGEGDILLIVVDSDNNYEPVPVVK